MSITNAVNTAVYGTITATSSITSLLSGTAAVYDTQAPDGAVLPYIVFSIQTETPDNDHGSDTRQVILSVRGFSGTPSTAGSIDGRLSSLFHRNQFTVAGYVNFWTVRETYVPTVEIEPNGKKIYGRGALYRVRLDPS